MTAETDLVQRLRNIATAFEREFPQYGGGIYREAADAILARSSSVKGVAVPAGWRLVPEEPTDEMHMSGETAIFESERAARKALEDIRAKTGGLPGFITTHAIAAWKAMLAAAPTPHAAPVDAVTDAMVESALAAINEDGGVDRGFVDANQVRAGLVAALAASGREGA